MPKFGEENLGCHLASTGCGAADWAKKRTSVLEVERPQADDRRRVKVADDGAVIDTKTKMTWHFETAKMTSSIGSLPGELFDNGIFKAWVGTITRGAYLGPGSRTPRGRGGSGSCGSRFATHHTWRSQGGSSDAPSRGASFESSFFGGVVSVKRAISMSFL